MSLLSVNGAGSPVSLVLLFRSFTLSRQPVHCPYTSVAWSVSFVNCFAAGGLRGASCRSLLFAIRGTTAAAATADSNSSSGTAPMMLGLGPTRCPHVQQRPQYAATAMLRCGGSQQCRQQRVRLQPLRVLMQPSSASSSSSNGKRPQQRDQEQRRDPFAEKRPAGPSSRQQQSRNLDPGITDVPYWDLLSHPDIDESISRAKSASDAAVLRRKGHLKEQDRLIEFMRDMHDTHTCEEVMVKMERWVQVGVLFTRLTEQQG